MNVTRVRLHIPALSLFLAVLASAAQAEERFPPPDFTSSGYTIPSPTAPPPRVTAYEYLDMAALLAALSVTTYLVLRKRSRRAVFWMMLVSVAYFGFWRKGCVCPIGAIQNVTQGLADASFVVPLSVLVFFCLPLLFTLMFGRTFCAGVCPLGGLQDAVVFKPVAVPNWLNHALGLLPFLYLGVAVLFAATGSAYIICEYDPFVPLFRRDGPATMLALGGLFLLVGLFVARPYCRFFCPYGALLQLCSLVSRRRVTIYPDRCIDCHLCDESCPVAAIRRTAPPPSAAARAQARKWLLASLLLLPLLVAGGAFVGSRVSQPLARMHSTVRLADRIHLEESGQAADATDPSKAFRRTAQTPQALYQEAGVIGGRFKTGGAWLGAFMGLVIALKLVSLAVRRPRTQYEADRATCVGCARCFDYCPGEKGLLDPEIAARTKTL